MEMTDSLYSFLKITNEILDLVLWTIFLSAAAIGIIALKRRKKHPTQSHLIIVVTFLTVFTIIYGSTVEPMTIVTKEKTIDIEDYEGEPIKFIIASDLHVGQFLNTEKIPMLVNEINKVEDADYLFLLGDSVNEDSIHLNDLDYLNKIKKSVIYVYGNHDYENAEPPVRLVEGITEKIEDLGFLILENNVITIKNGNSNIKIAGIKDLWSQEEDFSFLDDIKEEETLILLSHTPDGLIEIDENGYTSKVDLVLSGHTHGGEIRLPIIGSIPSIPMDLPKEYSKGYKEYKEIPAFITSGVGSTGTRLRLFNPPEIIVLTIE